MQVDGRALATQLYGELQNQISHLPSKPHVTVFTCAPNLATQQYLALKKRKATEVGMGVNVIELPDTATTEEVVQTVQHAQMQTDAIIVQLPLPAHLDLEVILNAVPVTYDADGMHYDGTGDTVLSPVVGAIAHITAAHDLLLATQKLVVVGRGRLVGAPAAIWAQKQGAQVTVLEKDTDPVIYREALAAADVIISGAGQPHLITADMVKQGVILFDAGTSEADGELVGDIHPDCYAKASLYTPVPGGIGPLTVAMLLKNVLTLARR